MWLTALIIFNCANLLLGSISDPTAEEIKRGFEVMPSSSWGQQAREQNSLRILCIGGSNTAADEGGLGYVKLLDTFIKNDLKRDQYFQSHSFTINNGRSGQGIDYFVGNKCIFEFELEKSKWPNVVIMDTSVNFYPDKLQTFERFVRSIAYKYKLNNLLCPDFMFYNMIHLVDMFRKLPAPVTREDRMEYVQNYKATFPGNGNEFTDDMIRQFAAHYGMPVISWGNATRPAAIRHYINASFDVVPWVYSLDGVHMSLENGTQFGIDHLLGPFFKEVMKPRKEVPFVDFNDVPRLYPADKILYEQISYTTLGSYHSKSLFNMESIIHKSEHTNWELIPFAHGRSCYGSSDTKGIGELRFHVPHNCSVAECHIHVGFMHSWNVSVIGDAECALHKHEHNDSSSVHLSNLLVKGQERVYDATIPVISDFPTVVSPGLHSVKCKNLFDNRLSCMMELLIDSTVVV